MRIRSLVEAVLWTAVAVVLFLHLPSTPGGRAYFSPESLESKYQSESLVGGKIPIYRSSFSYHRYRSVEYLIENGYWQPLEVNEPRWVLVNHGDTVRQLSWRAEEWIAWSDNNPEVAALMWPQALAALREDPAQIYRFSDILVCARMSDGIDDFREKIQIYKQRW